MNRKDFTPCAGCGKGVAHTGLPLFWSVEMVRYGIDATAVQQQHGMEQFFGGTRAAVALADVFSAGPIATPLGPAVRVVICEDCMTDKPMLLAPLTERGS